jgi:hypothetical protein
MALRTQELKAESFLSREYRLLDENHKQIEINRAQRQAASEQLEGRFKEYLSGRGTLDILLESQRVWADALRAEFDAIVQYNNAIIGFEFAKGTILQRDNIVIGEGPLPSCAAKRAVEHERQRAKALLVRERANPIANSACDYDKGSLGIPVLPANQAASLPSILEGQPPLPPDINDAAAPKMPAAAADAKAGSAAVPAASGNGTPGVLYLTPATSAGSDSAAPAQPKSMMEALRRWRTGSVGTTDAATKQP